MKYIDLLVIFTVLFTLLIHRRGYKQCALDSSRAPLVYYMVFLAYVTSILGIMAAVMTHLAK
jgi:hypothetical protein